MRKQDEWDMNRFLSDASWTFMASRFIVQSKPPEQEEACFSAY